MSVPPRERFLELLRAAVEGGTLVKLTLGKHRGADATLQNLFVRPITLKGGPQLTFVWRHDTRDITKNHAPAAALALLEPLIGADFLDAHLFTPTQTAQLECSADGKPHLRVKAVKPTNDTPAPPSAAHNREKDYVIPANAPWLRALGITNDRAQPREGMADKFRQIQKFSELLSHLIADAFPRWSALTPTRLVASDPSNQRLGDKSLHQDQAPHPLKVVDMGSGKGYLTFAVAALLGERAVVHGIEARSELAALSNRIARENAFAPRLEFAAGTIADHALPAADIVIALHACDTATDDALAKGIAAGASLIVVSPCCQKELRAQLTAPAVLADALSHGIFQERQAEFVTDALRAQLLEWAGYRTKVFEFISTEHTAKNLMIAAIKSHPPGDAARAARVREFAKFYGVRSQKLAAHLQFPLLSPNER